MNDIEILLKKSSCKVEVPPKVRNRIKYALKNKNKLKNNWRYAMKKIVAIATTFLIVIIGGMSAYAGISGKFNGINLGEFTGIKFSNEYEKYTENIEGEVLKNGETIVSLVSSMCDDGITLLEFDVKLSDEDLEYLGIGNPILTDEIMQEMNIDESSEEYQWYYGKTNDLSISFNNEVEEKEDGIQLKGLNNYNITIDETNYWIRPRSHQQVITVSENEFKVYQIYFLTDKEIENKNEFEIMLNNVVLKNQANGGLEKIKYVVMDGVFKVKVSKNKLLEGTKYLFPECKPSIYKKMNKNVGEVICTPLQTVLKLTSIVEEVSLKSLEDTSNKDFIGLIKYKAYDEEKNELTLFRYETERIINYEDGTTKEWEVMDIDSSKNFENAQMILTEYIIIEKTNTQTITLVPELEDGTELESIEINLI